MPNYAAHFPAAPSHGVQLRPPYPVSTADELAAERDEIQRHVPLARRGAGGQDLRLAGTYGHPTLKEKHPDDHDDQGQVQEMGRAEVTLDGAKAKWAATKDGFKPENIQKILQDPCTVLTIRDVVQGIPDWKLLDPEHHAFARRALPFTEEELKGQEWHGKKKEEPDTAKPMVNGDGATASEPKLNGKPNANGHPKANGQASGNGTSSHNGATTANGTDRVEKDVSSDDGTDTDNDATPEERAFADSVLREMAVIGSFKNASGKPKGPLKPLGADAWKQLEMRIQVEDQGTPDNWIPRSQALHRLTGKHPMNAEADMSALFGAGMITPTKLHYVRNHGAVPCLDWDTHTLSVFADESLRGDEVLGEIPGLRLFKSRKFTMDDLGGKSAMFDAVELPVTMACTGNRRGEVNAIKRSAGYSWGASAVSTSLWRGVLVRDVLRVCGLELELNYCGRRLYLHFEGADMLSEGKYATSIPLLHALDPHNDVMLAFGQDGRVLHPDHGFPLRCVIPGFAGGRCIKWVDKMWISDKPSTNYYHIWDNRLIPSQVTDKNTLLARALFHHPDTGCNEQVLQSVICVPAHDERIILPKEEQAMYTVRGFAYHGAGLAVQRVEISLDGGQTWKGCFRQFVDEPLRHGTKHWAWVFWSCDVKYSELLNGREIIARAWDVCKNVQPERISWNILGMMNNAWYRVKLAFDGDPLALTAKHPVAPGAKPGWMLQPEEDKDKGSRSGDEKTFTLDEVAKHTSDDDCWIILDEKVYDVTSVLSWHPGGAKAITAYAGQASIDTTTQYHSIHDKYADSKKDECYIGVLSDAGVKAMREDAKRAAADLEKLKKKRAGLAVMPDTFCFAKLQSRKEVSKDTRLYTFSLPETNDGKPGRLGLPIGKHVVIAFHFKDQACTRSYTPVRPILPEEEDGTFDLLVKTYLPSAAFPPGGTMGNFLDVLQEGQEIDVRGPTGDIEYLGKGRFNIEGKKRRFSKINLVAGGSGLTPHWQLVHAILATEGDTTQVSMIDSNKTPDDILMRDELERYAHERKSHFKLWHTISAESKPDGWKYDAKHLDEAMMRAHLFAAEDGVAAFMCGPPGLIAKAAVPGLKAMGFVEGETMFGF